MKIGTVERLAIVGPSFFNYLEEMAQAISSSGVDCHYFDERPSNSVFGKAAIRFDRFGLTDNWTEKHVAKILKQIVSLGSTHVLLVSTEVIKPNHIEYLKSKGIQVFIYLWDSLRNKPKLECLLPMASAVASFDVLDCEKYGFAPINLYSSVETIASDRDLVTKEFDLYYCTTMHSNRPELVRRVLGVCGKRHWSAKLQLFFHKRWLWVLKNLSRPKTLPLVSRITSKPFKKNDIYSATRMSKVVLDVQHPSQSGLTMRTFEALSLGAVVLTTNQHCAKALPSSLLSRIVVFSFDEIEEGIHRSLKVWSELGDKPLSPGEVYSLSMDRFVDQILGLVGIQHPSSNYEEKENI